jgi:DNA-binding MarR family transcriptional regulator
MSKRDPLPYAVTLDVRDTCLCLHLQRAARVLARAFDDALRPLGLTNGQFSLLMSLNRPTAARPAEIAELLAMDRTTLIANVKPLERRGLVAVTVDAGDKRGRLLALTSAGRVLLAAALPVWQRLHATAERRLARPEAFRAGLDAMAAVEIPPVRRRRAAVG